MEYTNTRAKTLAKARKGAGGPPVSELADVEARCTRVPSVMLVLEAARRDGKVGGASHVCVYVCVGATSSL